MLNPGDLIDIWVVEKALGSGGMGSVYRCHNRNATRILAAIKTLDIGFGKSKGAEERFIREAEILFQLDHPNIVKVRNVRTETAPPYLEMEFVEGESLDRRLESGAFPVESAFEVMIQLADAVAYLHDKNIRHRDIKPANVLMRSDGRLKLVDFGLAMEADASRLTQAGMTFGTVSYAPPEWIAPDTMDPVRWDVYATGVVFWEVLTGQVAFPVSNNGSARQQALSVILQKQNHEPLDPGPAYHEPLRHLIREMTTSNPERRLDSVATAASRLRGMERTLAGPHGQTPTPSRGSQLAQGRNSEHTWMDATPAPPSGRGAVAGAVSPLQRATPQPAPAPARPSPAAQAETLRPTSMPSLDVEPRSRWPWFAAGGVLLLAVGFGIATLATGGAAVLWMQSADGPRETELALTGLPADLETGVWIDGKSVKPSTPGVFPVGSLPPGEYPVRIVVGEGCAAACETECPAWCGDTTCSITVEPGEGVQTVRQAVEAPTARTVEFTAKVPENIDWTLFIGDLSFPVHGPKGQVTLLPGRHTVQATHNGEPARSVELVVPWGTGTYVTTLDYEVVAPVVAPPPVVDPPKIKPDPKTPPEEVDPNPPTSGGPGKLVTVKEFARWLSAHPEWQRDAAIAAEKADAAYLEGWDGANPPAGVKGPVVGVNWIVANIYCRDRDGLAPVDAEPQKWSEVGSAPSFELRVAGKKPVLLSGMGELPPFSRKDTIPGGGLRCAR